MSEQFTPRAGDKTITLKLFGNDFTCHRRNTTIFTHSMQEQGDHFFIANDDVDETIRGSIIWREYFREAVGGLALFGSIADRLRQIECPEIPAEYMTEADHKLFVDRFGFEPAVKGLTTELTTVDLTPRQENRVHFLGYLLQNDFLRPIDFQGEGALYI